MHMCRAETEEDSSREKHLIGPLLYGERDLIEALRIDPDTRYPDSYGGPSSMREIATRLVSFVVAARYCEKDPARHLQAALDGLPR